MPGVMDCQPILLLQPPSFNMPTCGRSLVHATNTAHSTCTAQACAFLPCAPVAAGLAQLSLCLLQRLLSSSQLLGCCLGVSCRNAGCRIAQPHGAATGLAATTRHGARLCRSAAAHGPQAACLTAATAAALVTKSHTANSTQHTVHPRTPPPRQLMAVTQAGPTHRCSPLTCNQLACHRDDARKAPVA